LKLVVTGGGTGGHVFPALELARVGREKGAEVAYFGSVRGQESLAAPREGLRFVGFPSAPLYSLRTWRGWKGLAGLLRARVAARGALMEVRPNVVFATGGYSSAPVAGAALALGIPLVMHESNSVPGRSNRLFAKRAKVVATTFYATERALEDCRVVRTGLPIRRELRRLADGPRGRELLPLVFVFGGSQGAKALNEAALGAAARMHGQALHWVHATGKANFEEVFSSFEKLGLSGSYEVKSYLEAEEMGATYTRAAVAVTRGGAGTLSELAAFRLPAVAVPFPSAHANHQLHNVREFAEMAAATLLVQSELHPSTLERELRSWLEDHERRERAAEALSEWDTPKADEEIWKLIEDAAR
jgi:UDP-N-acetylglucosamine--N-acetylmuramyl-(pentapeptide) pyrophosphoryl-undecaprenol N-acetylglucosamine transferase